MRQLFPAGNGANPSRGGMRPPAGSKCVNRSRPNWTPRSDDQGPDAHRSRTVQSGTGINRVLATLRSPFYWQRGGPIRALAAWHGPVTTHESAPPGHAGRTVLGCPRRKHAVTPELASPQSVNFRDCGLGQSRFPQMIRRGWSRSVPITGPPNASVVSTCWAGKCVKRE
jgi:hypothetical protein